MGTEPGVRPGLHAYEPDPQSGAGNCVCGVQERHRSHPHVAMGAALTDGGVILCVCGLPCSDLVHERRRHRP
jgi:hypothetical protein